MTKPLPWPWHWDERPHRWYHMERQRYQFGPVTDDMARDIDAKAAASAEHQAAQALLSGARKAERSRRLIKAVGVK